MVLYSKGCWVTRAVLYFVFTLVAKAMISRRDFSVPFIFIEKLLLALRLKCRGYLVVSKCGLLWTMWNT